MWRILIADDHGLLRAGLRSLLRSEPEIEVVGEAADGNEALALTAQLNPDVLLADVGMPGITGIELARAIKVQHQATRVLILTMHEDGGLLQEALRAGASGYLIKRAAESDLITAIRAVVRGDVYVHPAMQHLLPRHLQPRGTGELLAAPGQNGLNDEECGLLRLVVQGKTNQEIGAALGIDLPEVEQRQAALMAKLKVHGRVGLIRAAKQRGLA